MAFGLQEAFGDSALNLSAQGTGTVQSGPVATPGAAAYVLLMAHVTTITGTSPTAAFSLEESADNSTWTAVTGSSATTITAAGNAVAFAKTVKNYVRVTVTVGGTTPAVTGTAAVLVFAE